MTLRKKRDDAKPAEAAGDLSGLRFFPATPSRWADLDALFGERGACGGCWCMAWRLHRRDFQAGKGAGNRRALRKIVASGEKPGILGYLCGEAVAWCSVAPRKKFVVLENSRVLAPVDEVPVWSVSCMFVKKPHRRAGVSVRMLRAAVEFAAKHGAKVVEGYPVEPSMGKMPDPFIWTGIPAAFRAAGFREVLRRSRSRPIMRFEIGPGRRPGRG
jgi:GNAT superfamily N-acetyltransferase